MTLLKQLQCQHQDHHELENLLLDNYDDFVALMKPQVLKRRKCSNVTMNRLYYLMSVDVIVWLYDVIK